MCLSEKLHHPLLAELNSVLHVAIETQADHLHSLCLLHKTVSDLKWSACSQHALWELTLVWPEQLTFLTPPCSASVSLCWPSEEHLNINPENQLIMVLLN